MGHKQEQHAGKYGNQGRKYGRGNTNQPNKSSTVGHHERYSGIKRLAQGSPLLSCLSLVLPVMGLSVLLGVCDMIDCRVVCVHEMCAVCPSESGLSPIAPGGNRIFVAPYMYFESPRCFRLIYILKYALGTG